MTLLPFILAVMAALTPLCIQGSLSEQLNCSQRSQDVVIKIINDSNVTFTLQVEGKEFCFAPDDCLDMARNLESLPAEVKIVVSIMLHIES